MRKPICGYENLYEVDDCGNVYSIRAGIRLKPNFNKGGYAQYSLNRNGKRKMFLGHRLVAEAFIPNPQNLPIINHKDENKKNNHVDNLEWCTHSYNSKYGSAQKRLRDPKHWMNGVIATKRKVLQILNGEIINEYESISEAGRSTGTNIGNISSCCLNIRKTANKYQWKFKEETL